MLNDTDKGLEYFWAVGMSFEFRGASWQVRAISEVGRRRYLDLLARRSH